MVSKSNFYVKFLQTWLPKIRNSIFLDYFQLEKEIKSRTNQKYWVHRCSKRTILHAFHWSLLLSSIMHQFSFMSDFSILSHFIKLSWSLRGLLLSWVFRCHVPTRYLFHSDLIEDFDIFILVYKLNTSFFFIRVTSRLISIRQKIYSKLQKM